MTMTLEIGPELRERLQRAAEQKGLRLPGEINANAIGQRRWALEWAVVFRGPYHDRPPGWDEVDLSI